MRRTEFTITCAMFGAAKGLHLLRLAAATAGIRSFSANSTAASAVKRVGTHNGSFHCDEALACFMIRLTDDFSGAEIVRTRDPQVLETMDAVLDVGGVYDPFRYRFDHHQEGFEKVLGHGFSTKLSSAGLIYKHYGMEIIAKELQSAQWNPDVFRLFRAIYRSFMEAIDAVDNGINQYDSDQPPTYVNNTHLSSRVGRLNLDWTDPDQSPEKENEAFQRAMNLAGGEFLETVRFHIKSWLPARSIAMKCFSARKEVDPSGEIVVLESLSPMVWKLHLYELEEEMKIYPPIKFVLYRDDKSKEWRVQAVGVAPDRFKCRKTLPHPWRGLRNKKLSKETGIPGCVFVHTSGFIGGNQTYEGALQMAKDALKF